MQKSATQTLDFVVIVFFITYPQSNLSKDIIVIELAKHGENKYIVAEEFHKTEGKHFHIYVEYKKKIDTKRQDFFNILEEHPNIQKLRRRDFVTKYVTKDGDYKTNFSIDELIEIQKPPKKKTSFIRYFF